jgi:glucuronosyltransferase
LDDAKDGAVLLSFGSNVKSTFLPEEKLSALINVIRKLKQKVIMKWESKEFKNKPDNLLISEWMPQDDILAHPKIKYFITHGGFGGITEAKFHGIPIICVPFAGDQHVNCKKSEEEGFGIMINLAELTEETLSAAIKEILTNNKYTETVKKFSNFIRDRPMSALDTAIYWTEYVLRHHGAPHLHYPGADLNFFQYNSIDVILFLFGSLYISVKLMKTICKALFCRKRKNDKVKMN